MYTSHTFPFVYVLSSTQTWLLYKIIQRNSVTFLFWSLMNQDTGGCCAVRWIRTIETAGYLAPIVVCMWLAC